MKSWKKLVASIAVMVFLSRGFLYWISFGPVLDDKEFDDAIRRAEKVGISDIESIRDYPFSTITRAEAVERYVKFGQYTETIPVRSHCEFSDIDETTDEEKQNIILACQYGFFGGSLGSFEPDFYMTKGTSLVALMRGILPHYEFEEVEEYWIPYVQKGNELGITKREPGPYVNYLITRYELILQLWRGVQFKQSKAN